MLAEKLQQDLKSALFAKDELKVSTLRMLIADAKNFQIEKQKELTDEDYVTLLERSVKRHRESIEGFEKGGRAEMADKEKKELEILQTYRSRPQRDGLYARLSRQAHGQNTRSRRAGGKADEGIR